MGDRSMAKQKHKHNGKKSSKPKASSRVDGALLSTVSANLTMPATMKVDALLRFVLSIKNDTGNGTVYADRSAHDKCDVKNALLAQLKKPNVGQVLADWKS